MTLKKLRKYYSKAEWLEKAVWWTLGLGIFIMIISGAGILTDYLK